ncbi:hypothetical protein CNMCM5623_009804 [Aspergillus felis]|uniref:Zn(2)-C6 fungal-type domain-containing protein n=1 Tax=Aspergillus felis TaxID=1287682 RepID=A0A8H6UVG6_9EURO|nr:hypothetical protein CNMCM5623_009804 [Aspergillus felis]
MFRPKLKPLACVRCQVRKVRCSKEEGGCNGCRAVGVPCVYNKRRPRGAKAALQSNANGYRTSNGTSALSGRVQNLEELVNNLLKISPHCIPSHPFNTSQSVSHSSAEEEATASLGEGKVFHVDPIVSTWPRDDILGQLTISIHRFKALALQQLPATKPTDALPILPDRAKELIDSCLQQLGEELFVSLVDSELIMKLPDVMNMPHVQLDVSILLVYYLLLYQGCSIEDDKSSASSDLASRLYLKCISILPQWRDKAAATTMYFVGALGMSLAAMEYQDFELSWTLHSKASTQVSSVNGKASGSLIPMDMNFRLFHNMVPTISGTDWNVNLPWLSYKPGIDGGGHPSVSTAAFIANSRLTLTLIGMEYTSALDKSASDPLFGLECHIDMRCNEIEATLEEWYLVRLSL